MFPEKSPHCGISPFVLDCAGQALDLVQPQVMAILNVTPDSFSDGGDFLTADDALIRARQMVAEGAAIIDVGGESTRPGAEPVSIDQELSRVIPVIEAIHKEISIPISIDTSKAEVMRAAVAAGAGMINDVRALQEQDALEAAVDLGVPVCLMHMQGKPGSMQQQPHYDNVLTDIKQFLALRIEACLRAGLPAEKLLIDPGFGFGKTLSHNLELLRHLDQLQELGLPIVAGLSRKSMIATILDVSIEQRLYGSIALATLAVWQGASIIRAHDVRATFDAVRISYATKKPDRTDL